MRNSSLPAAAAAAEQKLLEEQAAAAALSAPTEGPPAAEDQFEELIDIDRVEGRVRASSVKKVGEIVEKHPEEALFEYPVLFVERDIDQRRSIARAPAEREHTLADDARSGQRAEQQRPRPKTKLAGQGIAEHDHKIEHERQIERRYDEARHGEARKRYARPATSDERDKDDSGNEPAKRNDPEHVALEHVAEGVHPVVDRKPREPRQPPGARANAVQCEIARNHSPVDAEEDEPHGHEPVDHDVAAKNDCKIFVRERQQHQRDELGQQRLIKSCKRGCK